MVLRSAIRAARPRRGPATLAGDQLVATGHVRAHDDRLQDASLADRISERAKRLLVEAPTGV
jgi:hypothetical protein